MASNQKSIPEPPATIQPRQQSTPQEVLPLERDMKGKSTPRGPGRGKSNKARKAAQARLDLRNRNNTENPARSNRGYRRRSGSPERKRPEKERPGRRHDRRSRSPQNVRSDHLENIGQRLDRIAEDSAEERQLQELVERLEEEAQEEKARRESYEELQAFLLYPDITMDEKAATEEVLAGIEDMARFNAGIRRARVMLEELKGGGYIRDAVPAASELLAERRMTSESYRDDPEDGQYHGAQSAATRSKAMCSTSKEVPPLQQHSEGDRGNQGRGSRNTESSHSQPRINREPMPQNNSMHSNKRIRPDQAERDRLFAAQILASQPPPNITSQYLPSQELFVPPTDDSTTSRNISHPQRHLLGQEDLLPICDTGVSINSMMDFQTDSDARDQLFLSQLLPAPRRGVSSISTGSQSTFA